MRTAPGLFRRYPSALAPSHWAIRRASPNSSTANTQRTHEHTMMAMRAAFMIAWCLSRPSPSYQPRYANVAPALGMRPGSMQCTQTRCAWTTTSACKIPFGLGLVRAIGVAPRTAPTTLPPPRATPRRFAAAKLVAARPLPSGTQSGVARMSMPLPPRGWTSPPSRRTRRCGTTSVVPHAPR